ncbi:MAG: complex I NDUFA9 subunit family protein [Gammaproteobacteria bacterium]|nr:complex I NDUFA9 subunit family protein [Gammaproteobacteria bacterium]
MEISSIGFRKQTRRRIAILGGTGFVGSHLVARLARDGHRIKVLSRLREDNRHLLVNPTVDVQTTNVFSSEALVRAFENVDTVINLVGILNESGHSGKGFRQAHVDFTQRAANAAEKAGVRRFLQMSALGAGPNGPSHYLRSKGEAENLLMTHAARHMRVTIFKPSVIFGPGDSFINRFAGLLKIAPIMPLACPDAKFSPVSVADVCEAFARSIENEATVGKRLELCGPETWTLKEIVEYVRDQLGLRRLVLPLPNWASKMQSAVFEFVPGKPFSRDNYNSLQLDSVCSENGFALFGIQPSGLDAVVPYYLRPVHPRRRYDEMRRRARRAKTR